MINPAGTAYKIMGLIVTRKRRIRKQFLIMKINRKKRIGKKSYNGGGNYGGTYERKKWGNDKKGWKNSSGNGSGIAKSDGVWNML